MSISCYGGLQGTGKSFEVVSAVIVPAVARGRRVVCNIDGIDSDAIRAYCVEHHGCSLNECGSVVVVSTDDIRNPLFFCGPSSDSSFDLPDWIPRDCFYFYVSSWERAQSRQFTDVTFGLLVASLTSLRSAGFDVGSCLVEAGEKGWKTVEVSYFSTRPRGSVFASLPSESDRFPIVQPGDLVAVDEAYSVWGSDCKIPAEHKVFFREHRHYTHAETGVSCDLVLMTQDIGDLHRILKVVIEQSFKTHKAKGIGRNDLYTLTMWEGWKQTEKGIIKDWTKTYAPAIFPLYKSYSGTVQGKELLTDSRQNIFADRKLLIKIGLFALVCVFILYRLFHYVWVGTHPVEESHPVASSSPAAGVATPAAASASIVSTTWRLAGVLVAGDHRRVLLVGDAGRLRVVDAVMYFGDGLTLSGKLDGQNVSRFSGPSIASQGSKP